MNAKNRSEHRRPPLHRTRPHGDTAPRGCRAGAKPFPAGAEFVPPAAKDTCGELSGGAAVRKVARVPLQASSERDSMS